MAVEGEAERLGAGAADLNVEGAAPENSGDGKAWPVGGKARGDTEPFQLWADPE